MCVRVRAGLGDSTVYRIRRLVFVLRAPRGRWCPGAEAPGAAPHAALCVVATLAGLEAPSRRFGGPGGQRRPPHAGHSRREPPRAGAQRAGDSQIRLYIYDRVIYLVICRADSHRGRSGRSSEPRTS